MKSNEDKIQWVYDHLCDDRSKYIFENRKSYSESGEWK